MKVEQIAEICHEANRVYCRVLGDMSQLCWAEAPNWQKESAISGVKFHLKDPNAGPEASHEEWLRVKSLEGWSWGEKKDVEKKEHPCFCAYVDLPLEQQVKDSLFLGIVNALKPSV